MKKNNTKHSKLNKQNTKLKNHILKISKMLIAFYLVLGLIFFWIANITHDSQHIFTANILIFFSFPLFSFFTWKFSKDHNSSLGLLFLSVLHIPIGLFLTIPLIKFRKNTKK